MTQQSQCPRKKTRSLTIPQRRGHVTPHVATRSFITRRNQEAARAGKRNWEQFLMNTIRWVGTSPIGQEVKAHVNACGWEVCNTIFARPPKLPGGREAKNVAVGTAL